MGSNKTIVWFRRDLRIEDNLALAAAARDSSVFPVYIWCPEEEGQFYPGRVSRWWLKQSLAHLDQSFKSLGAKLVLIKTQSTLAALLKCIEIVQATKVVFNHLYDPVSLVRDHSIKEKLAELGISVQSYNGDLLYEPWEIYDERGHAFTTFDAYWNRCLSMELKGVSIIPPWRMIPSEGILESCPIEELGLEAESEKSSNALLGRAWSPGWSNGDKVLTEFVEQHLLHYSKNRKKVGGDSTSLLSPYLHFGELSVRKVFQLARMKQLLWANEQNSSGVESVTLFLQAIGLREYSRYLCFNFPFTHERSLLSNLNLFPWHADQPKFKAWRQGRTGYPLVDAGMRELWATGWIHNRIRVIVSSFAVKILLLPWKWGMKYFWDTLLDADLESDILGWQYISGSLPDGYELERLDDPETQGAKFDPEVEIDLARERLTEAIFKMRELQAAAASTANSNGTNEEVVDNCVEILDIPTVVLKEKTPSITVSSNDQKVPSLQNFKIDPSKKKRSICLEDERIQRNININHNRGAGFLGTDEDLCSTAQSSSSKKQVRSKVSIFCSPEFLLI
ncbi:cryptochrome-1-like [Quillaja saponaria]|uniref:Cryptochrome-1-like n=1 Tax=Quillaja saponaria TaxID=32244 RepID=A0AAD7LBB1_QUISA|nr:cryptochrome-1-like [Quillaja saponaria]